jgi:hypothetical protein
VMVQILPTAPRRPRNNAKGPKLYIRPGGKLYECIVCGNAQYGIIAWRVPFGHSAGFSFLE